MMVLKRKIGEQVKIGDDVTIVVLDVRGRDVRLGIEAPRAVPVYRAEILDGPDQYDIGGEG